MINGILNIYKEKGYTSHDVVARLRGIVGQKKIGHTGTLDPDAEGVLPVCLGRATKVCDLLTDKDKTYRAVLLLGRSTDTQDISGAVLEERDPSGLGEDMVRACVESFTSAYDQIPPMYSALKVNGKKLYELARAGKTVERKSRRITIYDIRIQKIELPRVWMEIECSKGTYIRTLCHDIGEKLGTGGCMESLIRTKTGEFEIKDSRKLDEVETIVREGRLSEILFPTDHVFTDYSALTVIKSAESAACNGNPLRKNQVVFQGNPADSKESLPGENCRYRLYDTKGTFIGIFKYDETKRLFRPEKMFLAQ